MISTRYSDTIIFDDSPNLYTDQSLVTRYVSIKPYKPILFYLRKTFQ